MSFAANLRAAMDAKCMTKSKLAAACGIGKSSISQYLSGKNIPRAPVLARMADVLDVDAAALAGQADVSPADASAMHVTVSEAARMMGKSQQFVRVALQRGLVPFGTAVQISGTRWTYYISRKRLMDYIGL